MLVHEGGHFVAAKLSGIKVEEFAFGFGPRLFSRRRGETLYSLNLFFPLGAFVKLSGEEDPSEPRSFANKGPAVRFMVLFAGPLMSAILPIVLLTIAFMVPRGVAIEDVVIEDVVQDSPAAMAGIESGDYIVSVNGHQVQSRVDVTYYVYLSLGEKTTILLKKVDGTEKLATLVPRLAPPEGQGPLGIEFYEEPINLHIVSQSYSILEAVPKSVSTLGEAFGLIISQMRSWSAGGSAPSVGGPVAIFQLTGDANEAGPSYLIQFAAMLSFSLAIINILPLPALDGGRIVFVLLEVVRRGKRVSPRTEGLVHLVGFAMLIGLILVISYYDILRVIRGGSL